MECFTIDWPSLKDIKKSMQITWSDTDFEESGSTTFEDARYDPNEFLAFIASVESTHDSECDSDSDDEFINNQKAVFFFLILLLSIKNWLRII